MRILKLILFALLGIIALALIIAVFLPKDYKEEGSEKWESFKDDGKFV